MRVLTTTPSPLPHRWVASCKAMDVFAIDAEDQGGLQSVLAAVLHIGNLTFHAVHMAQQDDGSAVSAAAKARLAAAAELLGLNAAAFEESLTVKSVGKFPVVQVPQPPAKAAATRDAFARALYGQLFLWAIGRINATMGSDADTADAKRSIGMLDIFGFESFKTNSLEQLLINFANERLQAHFNEYIFASRRPFLLIAFRWHSDSILIVSLSASLIACRYIFRLEEAECQAEGVACPQLTFADNSAVMTLMTSKPTGILSLMNEEVLVPNASDAQLLQKLTQQHKGHSEFKVMPRAQGDGFVVHHYAGPVSYLIEGFVEKNRDQLPGELVQLVSTSQMPLLQALFKQGGAVGSDAPQPSTRGGGGARWRALSVAARVVGGRRATALAAQFVESLDSLIHMLQSTTPHFVRCVKPNSQLVSDRFDGNNVMRQLREMGMVHVVRARKQGFAHRYTFERFTMRYAYLIKGRDAPSAVCAPAFLEHLQHANPPPGERRDCVTILAMMVADKVLAPDGWAVGTGKIFLKEAQQQQLEVARESYLLKVVIEQLQAAIAKSDITALEGAIAGALEVHLQSPLVGEAQQLLALLQSQARAAAALHTAIDARDINSLETALAMAAKVGLVNDLVQHAIQLVAQLFDQQKATNALSEALQRNNADALKAALAEAGRVGLNTGLVKEAERRLNGLEKVADLDQQLQRASQGYNIGLLTELLQRAEDIALGTPVVQTAQQRRADLQEAVQVHDALTRAAAVNADASGIQQLLARARMLAVRTPELIAAEKSAESALAGQARKMAAAAETQAVAAAAAAAAAEQQRQQEAQAQAQVQAQAQAQAQVGAAARAAAQPEWVSTPEGDSALPCMPLSERARRLQRGTSLIKVAPACDRWKESAPPPVLLSSSRNPFPPAHLARTLSYCPYFRPSTRSLAGR